MFRKGLKILAGVAAVLLLAMAITGGLIISACGGSAGESPYLLVLGTVVEGTEPSAMLRDRILGAYDYLTAHPEVICIVSGYKSASAEISEAECMQRELVALGIDPERIWMEDQATSTYENLTCTLKLIEEKTGQKPEMLGILSSEFHLYRAGLLARELGVPAFTIPAKTTDLPTLIYYFLRETVVLWTCIF